MPDHTTPSSTLPSRSDAGEELSRGVLLVHGQPGSSLIWTKLQPRLRRYGMRVVAVDRLVRRRGGEALDQFGNAAALARQLDAQGGSPVVVVGHSLGAGIALTLAAIAPHHVRALVLLAPTEGPAAVTPIDRLLAAPVVGPTLAWLGFRAAGAVLNIPQVRRRLLIDRAGLSVADAKEVVRLVTRGTVWRSFTAEQREVVKDAERVQKQLRDVHCPVVLVAGRRDDIAGPDVVCDLAERLPESITVLTDTGHFIPFDDPDIVVEAVLRVLRLDYRQSLSRRPAKPTREHARRSS